jgi:hypothetical protein
VVASFLRYRELCCAAALLLVFFLFFWPFALQHSIVCLWWW